MRRILARDFPGVYGGLRRTWGDFAGCGDSLGTFKAGDKPANLSGCYFPFAGTKPGDLDGKLDRKSVV